MAQKQIELQDLDLQQLVEVKKQLEDVRSHLLASVQDCALGHCSELVRGRWNSSSSCQNKHADYAGEEEKDGVENERQCSSKPAALPSLELLGHSPYGRKQKRTDQTKAYYFA